VEGEVEALGSRGRGSEKETFTAEAACGIASPRPKRRISKRPARREEARPGSPRGAPPTGPSAQRVLGHPEGTRAPRVAVSETRDPPGSRLKTETGCFAHPDGYARTVSSFAGFVSKCRARLFAGDELGKAGRGSARRAPTARPDRRRRLGGLRSSQTSSSEVSPTGPKGTARTKPDTRVTGSAGPKPSVVEGDPLVERGSSTNPPRHAELVVRQLPIGHACQRRPRIAGPPSPRARSGRWPLVGVTDDLPSQAVQRRPKSPE
jgi:hypothetical protein